MKGRPGSVTPCCRGRPLTLFGVAVLDGNAVQRGGPAEEDSSASLPMSTSTTSWSPARRTDGRPPRTPVERPTALGVGSPGVAHRSNSYTAPVDGSAVMKADGTVLAGLFVHALAEGNNNYTLEWKTDVTFAGSIKYDNDGDFSSNGGMLFNAIDCKTVPLP